MFPHRLGALAIARGFSLEGYNGANPAFGCSGSSFRGWRFLYGSSIPLLWRGSQHDIGDRNYRPIVEGLTPPRRSPVKRGALLGAPFYGGVSCGRLMVKAFTSLFFCGSCSPTLAMTLVYQRSLPGPANLSSGVKPAKLMKSCHAVSQARRIMSGVPSWMGMAISHVVVTIDFTHKNCSGGAEEMWIGNADFGSAYWRKSITTLIVILKLLEHLAMRSVMLSVKSQNGVYVEDDNTEKIPCLCHDRRGRVGCVWGERLSSDCLLAQCLLAHSRQI